MATLRPNKTKGGIIWFVDFRYNGKRYRVSTQTGDRKLAELFLKDIEVRVAKNRFDFDDFKKVSLTEFFDKYLEYSRATKAENSYLLDRHSQTVFLTFAGDISLHNVTHGMIEEFKLDRLGDVKPASVNAELRHLKSMFQTAVEWGKTKKNPFSRVKQVRIKNNNLPAFFTKEQVTSLLETIPDGMFKDLVLVYLYTGMRRGEALKLTWKDIDLDSRAITINETKSGNNRVVPINKQLYGLLSSMDQNGSCLFDCSKWHVTHKFKDYLKKTGIEEVQNLTVHSLRHTFASHLVMDGVDLYTVAKLLGHSSVAVTQMYAHLTPDYLKKSVERLKF